MSGMVLKGINRLMMSTMLFFGREGTVKGSWVLNERQSDQKLSEEKKKKSGKKVVRRDCWKLGPRKVIRTVGSSEKKKDGGDSRVRGSGDRAAADGGLTD